MKSTFKMFLALLVLMAAGCFSTETADESGPNETLGEVQEPLCASYPFGGVGDGDGSGAATDPSMPTGMITKMRIHPMYTSMIELTHTTWAGVATTGVLNFGNVPAGSTPNIAFIRALSPGWIGSSIVRINICNPQSMQPSWCGNNSCNQGPRNACMFVNNKLAFVWDWFNSPTNPGGSIIPSASTSSGWTFNGITGIWGTAPNEPGHFRLFDTTGTSSTSKRWTFANSVTCP